MRIRMCLERNGSVWFAAAPVGADLVFSTNERIKLARLTLELSEVTNWPGGYADVPENM